MIKDPPHGYIPKDWSEEPGQDTKNQFLCNITLLGHGICITSHSEFDTEEIISDQEFPSDLLNRDWLNAVIIPVCYANMYYTNYKIGEGLSHQSALSGPIELLSGIPEIQQGEQIAIVINFKNYLQRSKLRKVEVLEQPLKLKFFVMNEDGGNDIPSTSELYEAIFNSKQSMTTSDDDDSWMYRSRPMIYW